MSKRKNQRIIYVVGFLILTLGVGYLLFTGFNNNSVYFLHVSEALAKGPQNIDKARLFGQVPEDYNPGSKQGKGVEFELADKEDASQSIPVKYKGVLPESFKPGAEVIVKGSMKKHEGVFLAQELMTKCPSKYEKKKQD